MIWKVSLKPRREHKDDSCKYQFFLAMMKTSVYMINIAV